MLSRLSGRGEAIRVKQGERVLFHILNDCVNLLRSIASQSLEFGIG